MGEKIHQYSGKAAVVSYDAKRCIHAAECVHGLPNVFDPKARPWIDPDGAAADELVAVVARCPTGALHIARQDGGAGVATPTTNTVTIDPDGPLYACGDLEVVDSGGDVLLSDTRIALCRCGASANKPLCDGSHTQAEFQDAGGIAEPQLRAGDSEAGKLRVVVAKDGPLVLQGPLTLVGGEERCSGSRGALCRCGASENKPFCDGSHSRVGFSAA